MNNQQQMFLNLFGIDKMKITETVIMTPIFGINNWKGHVDFVIEEFKSKYYFSGINGAVNGENITIIFSGQGIQRVADCVYFLKNTKCKHIVYSGAAGGVGDVSIGDIIISNRIYSPYNNFKSNIANLKSISMKLNYNNLKILKNFIEDNNIKEAPTASLAGFFQENKKSLDYLREKNIKGIDFESFIFLKTAKKIGINPVILNYIYDKPGEIGFYVDNNKLMNIRNIAREKIIKLSLNIASKL